MAKLNHFLLLVILCLFCTTITAQTAQFTISGYIEDEATGEKLIGANIFDIKSGNGTSTNNYGFFSLTLPKDSVYINITYIGYQPKNYRLLLDKDITMNFGISEGQELETVEVTADRVDKIEQQTQMSRIDIPIQQIKKMPAFLGEVDVLKVIQLLPGVQSGNEGTSGIYVRGGSPDQNLILLDGVPVYNVTHLFGFFSVFNADAIKSVTLTKGGFPARFGGRLSSVLEINMKEGNMKEFHAEGSIGTIFSKLTVEGPIVKDKTSFLISGRRTYIDILARPFIKSGFDSQGIDGSIDLYFYDLNAKINHKFSDKDRLFISAYLGDDVFGTSFKEDFDDGSFESKAGLDWGNQTGSMRWNRVWNKKLFSNTTLTYSKYNFNTGFAFEEIDTDPQGQDERSAAALNYVSGIEDWGGKIDFDYIPNPNHYIKFGAAATHHTFTPGVSQFNIEQTGQVDFDTTVGAQLTESMEYGLYIEDDMKIGEKLQANVGVHASAFSVDGKTYTSIQPRLGIRYMLPHDIALKSSFSTMTQFIHLLTNEGVGLPTDLWVPTTKNIIPERSWQAAIGFAKTVWDDYEVSLEGYYKEMENLVSYKEGASFFNFDGNSSWEDKVTQGDGDSYGIEFLLQKKKGNTTGWIGYTYSKTTRQFDEINGGLPYPFKYDRRHDISIVVSHKFSERISASAVWVYGTGNSITLPESVHTGYEVNNFTNNPPYFPTRIETASNKNAYRMQPYHRLDLSVEFHKQKRKYKRVIVVGVYNAYSRVNPFFINDETRNGRRRFVQYGLFPIIPSVSYQFKI